MIEADVVTVHQDRDVRLIQIVARWKSRERVRGGSEKRLKLAWCNTRPIIDIIKRSVVRYPISEAACIRRCARPAPVAIINHPIFWHFVFSVNFKLGALCDLVVSRFSIDRSCDLPENFFDIWKFDFVKSPTVRAFILSTLQAI